MRIRSGLSMVAAPALGLLIPLLMGCSGDPSDLVRQLDEARGECDEERLRRSDEECVRMFERYADMGSEAMETYIGAFRAFDEALARRASATRFDTAGLGRAFSPGILEQERYAPYADGGAGWSAIRDRAPIGADRRAATGRDLDLDYRPSSSRPWRDYPVFGDPRSLRNPYGAPRYSQPPIGADHWRSPPAYGFDGFNQSRGYPNLPFTDGWGAGRLWGPSHPELGYPWLGGGPSGGYRGGYAPSSGYGAPYADPYSDAYPYPYPGQPAWPEYDVYPPDEPREPDVDSEPFPQIERGILLPPEQRLRRPWLEADAGHGRSGY